MAKDNYSKPKMSKEKNSKTPTKKVKPIYKPKKNLSVLQKRLMNEHKKHHSKEHLSMMRKLMKDGYCFQQAHDITMKKIGK